MSAHIVSNEVISNILGCYAACQYEENSLSDEKIKEMGQKLLDANCISFNYRYGEHIDVAFMLEGEALTHPRSLVQAIKYCNCLNYQSCQYPQWDRSEAKALLDEMREAFIRHLSGYKEAEWA